MSNKKSIIAVAAMVFSVAVKGQIVQQPQVIPAVQPQPAQIPFGPVLDVIPYVSADGYSIQMSIVPTLTEFLGYDTENARQFQTVIGGPPTQPTPLPGFRVRQITTSAIVWDGQTVVLGGLIAENGPRTRRIKFPCLGT